MGKKSDLSRQQRREIVLAMLRREEPIGVLARRCGVSETTLHRWRDDFPQAGEAALAYGKGKGKTSPEVAKVKQLEKELAERDRVIGELTIANRILRKTSDGLC